MARRRYDTTALIQDLKTDRRKGIGFSIAALVIILLLIGFSVSQFGSTAPEVPSDAAPVAASARDRAKALDEAIKEPEAEPTPPSAEEEPEPEAPPGMAKVDIVLPKKTTLMVDSEDVGKVKTHSVELPAGAHTFTMKLGKREVAHEEELAAGSTVQIVFKRRRATSKVIATAAAETPPAE